MDEDTSTYELQRPARKACIYIHVYFLITFSRRNLKALSWKYVAIFDISEMFITFAKSYVCNRDQNWKTILLAL